MCGTGREGERTKERVCAIERERVERREREAERAGDMEVERVCVRERTKRERRIGR